MSDPFTPLLFVDEAAITGIVLRGGARYLVERGTFDVVGDHAIFLTRLVSGPDTTRTAKVVALASEIVLVEAIEAKEAVHG